MALIRHARRVSRRSSTDSTRSRQMRLRGARRLARACCASTPTGAAQPRARDASAATCRSTCDARRAARYATPDRGRRAALCRRARVSLACCASSGGERADAAGRGGAGRRRRPAPRALARGARRAGVRAGVAQRPRTAGDARAACGSCSRSRAARRASVERWTTPCAGVGRAPLAEHASSRRSAHDLKRDALALGAPRHRRSPVRVFDVAIAVVLLDPSRPATASSSSRRELLGARPPPYARTGDAASGGRRAPRSQLGRVLRARARRARARSRSFARSRCRSSRVLARDGAARHAGRRRRACDALSTRVRAPAWTRLDARDLRARRRRVQHQLAAAAPRRCSSSASSSRRAASAAARPASRPTSTCSRGSRRSIRCRRRSSTTARSRSSSRPTSTRCRRRSIPTTGRLHTSLQPDRRRDRPPVAPAIRTCRTSPSAARRAGASAPRSSPAPGRCLIAADYSQIELRILAHLSGDPALVEAFTRGQDIHARTAAEVFDVAPALVSGEMRRRRQGDQLRHRLRHGAAAPGARARHSARRGAALHRELLRALRRRARVSSTRRCAEARRQGFVATILGRRRYLPELRSARAGGRASSPSGPRPTRPSRARPPTSSSSPWCARGVASAASGCRRRCSSRCTTSWCSRSTPGPQNAAMAVVREEMEGVMALAVPLRVDVHDRAQLGGGTR